MNQIAKQMKSVMKSVWADESAQGATEYILILVIIVGLVFAFKTKITSLIQAQLGTVESDMNNIDQSSSGQ
jgi:Flp pilus assembly pilin Flp